MSGSASETSTQPPHDPAATHTLRGIALFAGGVLVLAFMDSTTKFLAATYQVPLIAAVRYVINALLMIAIFAPRHGTAMIGTRRTGLVVLRGACLAAATLFAGLGVDLPLPTKIVIAMSNFVGSIFGFLLLVGIVAVVFAIKVWYGKRGEPKKHTTEMR